MWNCIVMALTIHGQSRFLSLSKGFALPFHGKIYVGGFDTISKKITVFEIESSLKKKDSIQLSIAYNLLEYYPITADTLHNYLQLIIQRKNATTVTVMRLRGCKIVSTLENVEVPRLYHSSRPGNYYFEANRYYKIEKQANNDFDRIRLTAFDISDTTGTISYIQKWNYTTDKPGVIAMNILSSTQQFVYIHAIRQNQMRYSSWLLKINRKNGQLIQAKRLENAGEDGILAVSDFWADTVNNYLVIGGQFYSQGEIKNSPDGMIFQSHQPSVTVIKIDSLMESTEWRRINFNIDPKAPKFYWQCYLEILSSNPFTTESAVTFYYTTEPGVYALGCYKTATFDYTSELNRSSVKFDGPVYDFIALHKKYKNAFSIKEMKLTDKLSSYNLANNHFAISTSGQETTYLLTTTEKQHTSLFKYALEGKTYKLTQQKETAGKFSAFFRLNTTIVHCILLESGIELKTLFRKD